MGYSTKISYDELPKRLQNFFQEAIVKECSLDAQTQELSVQTNLNIMEVGELRELLDMNPMLYAYDSELGFSFTTCSEEGIRLEEWRFLSEKK